VQAQVLWGAKWVLPKGGSTRGHKSTCLHSVQCRALAGCQGPWRPTSFPHHPPCLQQASLCSIRGRSSKPVFRVKPALHHPQVRVAPSTSPTSLQQGQGRPRGAARGRSLLRLISLGNCSRQQGRARGRGPLLQRPHLQLGVAAQAVVHAQELAGACGQGGCRGGQVNMQIG